MLADDVTAAYKTLVDSGVNPQMVAQFALTVGQAYSAAVQTGGPNSVDFPCQDDSMVHITITPGQAPSFTVIERVHAEMGDSLRVQLEQPEK